MLMHLELMPRDMRARAKRQVASRALERLFTVVPNADVLLKVESLAPRRIAYATLEVA